MNKDNIYRIIGYDGDYSDNVKKALRKLLKDNHPDHNGNRRIFELINEVKRELEENRVPFEYKNNKSFIKKYDDIDYNYCIKMKNSIEKDRQVFISELLKKRKELTNKTIEYKVCYQKDIDYETYFLSNSQSLNKLNHIKKYSTIGIILSIMLFSLSILFNNKILLFIFIVLSFGCIILVYNTFRTIQDLSNNNQSKLKKYIDINSKLRNNQTNQEKLKNDINVLKRKINNCENDLRFYNNILNNR